MHNTVKMYFQFLEHTTLDLFQFQRCLLADLDLISDTNLFAPGLMLIISRQINAEHEVEKS